MGRAKKRMVRKKKKEVKRKKMNSKKNKRAIVDGEHGRHHRVFLIRDAHVVKERSTDMYLRYGWDEVTALGHFEGRFNFK